MNYKIVISVAALLDIEQVIEWYESQMNGLGNRLKESLYQSLLKMESNPYSSSKKYKEIRVEYIKLFP